MNMRDEHVHLQDRQQDSRTGGSSRFKVQALGSELKVPTLPLQEEDDF